MRAKTGQIIAKLYKLRLSLVEDCIAHNLVGHLVKITKSRAFKRMLVNGMSITVIVSMCVYVHIPPSTRLTIQDIVTLEDIKYCLGGG